jgi:NDP-sugar pyrophosphorylase family protein
MPNTSPSIAILAGGLATRLGEVAKGTPKSLVDVGGRPFLAWQLDLLHAQGVDDVVLCVGHLGEQIEARIPAIAPAGMRVRFSYDGAVRRGTGGALAQALPLFGDPFLVMYGDSYLRCDYRAVLERLSNAPAPGALGVMTVFENQNQFDSSNVRFEHDRVLEYSKTHKTPHMRHIDWGLGVFRHAAFTQFASRPEFDLAELYEALVRSRQLIAVEVESRFYEVGSPEGLNDFRAFIASEPPQRGSRKS